MTRTNPASDVASASPGPRGERRRWLGLGVLAAGLSMIVIDGTVVSVALPVIIGDLRLGFADAQWINTVYSVVFAALLLTGGRLGDHFGRRRMFVLGVVVFLTGSLAAAMATGAAALLTARVLQGVGGACVLPATLSTVNATFRGRDRVLAFALWGAVISGMAAFGPLLGGWLSTTFTWPWIFLINLPVGALVVAGALMVVPETRVRSGDRGTDVNGILLSALGSGAVVFALIEGQSFGWARPRAALRILGLSWPATAPISPIPVIGGFGCGLLVLFVVWERHRVADGRAAILDPGLFNVPTFRWGNVAALAVAIGEFGLLFVVPLFLVNALGLTAMGAGMVLAAMAAGAFLAGGAARHLAARLGPVKVIVLGLALEVVGVGITALFVLSTLSPWLLALMLALYGAGLGLASAQLTGTILADVPIHQSGQASATQSTVRQLGAGLGTAVIGAVLSLGLAHDSSARLAHVPGIAPATMTQMAVASRQSAGSTIPALRAQGIHGPLGRAGPPATDALVAGFAETARTSMLLATAFLLLGLVAATRLRSRVPTAVPQDARLVAPTGRTRMPGPIAGPPLFDRSVGGDGAADDQEHGEEQMLTAAGRRDDPVRP